MTRLVGVELRRITSRRAVRALTVVLVGVAVLVGVQAVRTAVRHPGTQDWRLPEQLGEAAAIGAGLLSVYGFVVAATYAGADWAAGTVQSLLTWEPRRARVVAAKLAALLLWLLGVAVVIHVVLAVFAAVAADRGGSLAGVDAEFWRGHVPAVARALGLTLAIGALSFAIASLTRSTGAALGAGFVYFAILENALRILLPWTNRLLVGNAIAVWINGTTQVPTTDGTFTFTRLAAGLLLAAYGGGAVAVMTLLFVRRDVT